MRGVQVRRDQRDVRALVGAKVGLPGPLSGAFEGIRGTTDSLGERIQRKLPDAKVVKCFNTVTNSQMIDPRFRDGVPPMMICGDDADAKKRTEAFLREVGWPGVLDVGGIDGARWLEALVALWARVGMATGEWTHAFKVVR